MCSLVAPFRLERTQDKGKLLCGLTGQSVNGLERHFSIGQGERDVAGKLIRTLGLDEDRDSCLAPPLQQRSIRCPSTHYVDAALPQSGFDLAQQLRITEGHGRNSLSIAGCTAA